MTLITVSEIIGLPYKELRAKCIRMKINPDAHITEETFESLKWYLKDETIIIASKMNYEK